MYVLLYNLFQPGKCILFNMEQQVKDFMLVVSWKSLVNGCIDFLYSGVKTWKLTSNFPNRKNFWHVKGINKSSEKMPGYKHGGVRNRFYDITKAKYG